MNWTAVALVAALALGGCANQLQSVNRDGGIVENTSTAGAALKKAEAFCSASGRTAKTVHYSAFPGSLTFECVMRSGQ